MRPQQLELQPKKSLSDLMVSVKVNPPTDKYWQDYNDFLQRMIEWAYKEAPRNFDDSFIHSVYMQFHDRNRITPPQIKALINIALRFEIK